MSRTAGSAFGSTAKAGVIAALPAVGYLERSATERNPMICPGTETQDVLLELVTKTLAAGATEMEVEDEDREEHVLACRPGVGIGIARLDASSQDAHALRNALYQISRKPRIVSIEGIEYRLRARISESFEEDVCRVTITKC